MWHGVADGVVYADLDERQIARLDLYEGAFGYALIDVSVMTDTGARAAKMYLPPAGQPFDATSWSLAAWEKEHLQPTLFTVAEIFALQPHPTPTVLRQMWPVIEKRAWAKHRAMAEDSGPATLRQDPAQDDVTITQMGPPLGHFFRLQPFDLDHARFDGNRSETLTREVFMGVDAAMILPYDPVRDRVLLVEQLRMGPLLRRDPNPWALEPIAGMVDARETPLEAAIREGMEEANLSFDKIEAMPPHYPSPGASTDFFYCYLGLCDLPMSDAYTGGLIDEAEDLRLHSLPFEDAMALIDSGEIRIGVLITMLYWLARERDRLRSSA